MTCLVYDKTICATCLDSIVDKWIDVKLELNEDSVANDEDEYLCNQCNGNIDDSEDICMINDR